MLQEDFEADPRKEDWPNDAAEALGTGETTLLPLLEEWANASPGSFAPPMELGSRRPRLRRLEPPPGR
jgi:hypothetical protein